MAATRTSVAQAILDTYLSSGGPDAGNFVLSFSASDFGGKVQPSDISSDSAQSSRAEWSTLTTPQKKQLRFQPSVSLPGMFLSSTGDLNQVQETMARLRTLDLQGNRLTLQHAVDIIQALPQLHTLDMGKNPLGGCLPEVAPLLSSQLQTLSLNASEVQPEAVGGLISCLPALLQLHACNNQWNDVTPCIKAAGGSVAIKRLFLGGNPLDCLSTCLSALAVWDSLEHIDLAGTTFSSPVLVSSMEKCAPPAALSSLGLDECSLQSWEEVSAVATLPVPAVRLRRAAVLQPAISALCSAQAAAGSGEGGAEAAVQRGARGLYMPRAQACGEQAAEVLLRQITIALLPHVQTLNGSMVSGSDRVAAERFAVRYFRTWAPEEVSAAGIDLADAEANGFLQSMWQPPIMGTLLAKHGALGPLAVVDLGAPSSVTMEVSYEGEGGAQGGRGGSAGLPRSGLRSIQLKQTVGELKDLLREPLAAVPGAQVRCVLHVDPEVQQQLGPEELRYDTLHVSTLRPREGNALRVVVRGTGRAVPEESTKTAQGAEL